MSPDERQQLFIELAIAVEALDRAIGCLPPISESANELNDGDSTAEPADETQIDLFVDRPIPDL